ncbi:MAG: NAD(P)/FAD-dependent oxidoreductase [Spirochaetes bacterium]|jgi:pyruvate/2-oxoglutarate dehydrogenase complex dihydrolipoamide dehydrogenase (E3) component|nr:NAD(P)/FAD-dependent oxidoreductase [Spirochaetota bacterium]
MKKRYDLIVVGAGSAGLVAAVQAKGLQKKVLLIEKKRSLSASKFLNDIPCASLAYYASLISDSSKLENAGIKNNQHPDSLKLFNYIRDQVKLLSAHTDAKNLEKLGISFVFGDAAFEDGHMIACSGKKYTARKIIIATGSHPFIPDITGFDSESLLTTESFFRLKRLPGSIVIAGAGPAGCQMAAALSIMGVKVVLLEKGETILPREDDEMRRIIQANLKKRGVTLILKAQIEAAQIEKRRCTITLLAAEKKRRVTAEHFMVCCGRKANVEHLNLEAAGVSYNDNGIDVSRLMRTSVKHIYACGDVTGGYMYTNRAESQAAVAVVNAFGKTHKKMNYSGMIWNLMLQPEFAHLGLTSEEARARYGTFGIRIYKFPYKYSMNSIIRGNEDGMAKIVCRPSGRILGAHIYGESASAIAHELQLAKMNGIKFGKLSFTMHIFPSYGDVLTKPSLRCYIDHYSRNIVINLVRALLPHRRR